ncbi:hypothetical protein LAZ67_X000671 [Cordylochernes scorpioides]|uniref:Uncharacterized protein n=1 Tax=Cordylochernes scorpioides TaxID=51811 RepID=A0ABY6LS85_9ARAC|nr:hypothetical protein LAZ67_X000671 [Cordylochernes scorpioides]
MVVVYIDVENPLVGLEELLNGQNDVVDVTEARGTVRHGVVVSSVPVDDSVGIPVAQEVVDVLRSVVGRQLIEGGRQGLVVIHGHQVVGQIHLERDHGVVEAHGVLRFGWQPKVLKLLYDEYNPTLKNLKFTYETVEKSINSIMFQEFKIKSIVLAGEKCRIS